MPQQCTFLSIIAGIVLGKKAGAELGFVFGLTSLIKGNDSTKHYIFLFSPFVTIGTMSEITKVFFDCFVPRILLGYLAGFVFEIMKKNNRENLGVVVGALTGAITNTVLVLSGIYIFFGEAYASAVGVQYSTLVTVLLGVVSTNGILEAILGAIVSLAIYKALKPILKS